MVKDCENDPLAFDPPVGVAEQVAPGVRRILAPNPSPMTFRGTNTYVVGQGDVAVIDPGPLDSAHMEAITRALAGERITHVLVTHAHLDHSPLAPLLGRTSGAPVYGFGPADAGRSPVMVRLADDGLAGGGEGVDAGFAPDVLMADNAVASGPGWSLRALHTPGHMGNHLCFAMGDVVFTGDLVMGWSTSLVSPPDGDMATFMASCRRLRTLDARMLLPGHGAPVLAPQMRIDALIAHRESRERQVLAALDSTPRSIDAITRSVYTDLAPGMLPAARRNVLAHLIDLVSKNQANARPHLSQASQFTRTENL